MLGNLQTAMTSTHHAIKFAKCAQRDLAEVQYRSTAGTTCARSFRS